MLGAIRSPAWTFDFISNDPYTYALIRDDVPADSLAQFMNEQIDPTFDWKDAEWLCAEWDGPVAIKGVVRPDDALRALDVGFSTLWVSNTAGANSMAARPRSRAARHSKAVGPGGDYPRRWRAARYGHPQGTRARRQRRVGQPYLYGLGAGGSQGVVKALEILRVELERAMGLLGVGTVADLRARRRPCVTSIGARCTSTLRSVRNYLNCVIS